MQNVDSLIINYNLKVEKNNLNKIINFVHSFPFLLLLW